MNQYSRIKEYHRQMSKSELLASVIRTQESDKATGYTDKDIFDLVTDNVLAPALHGFVVWVLQQAVENHIKRLYFLARDGYFMYRTAANYVRVYGLAIECRYLYCSRYSVRIPAYHLDEEKALSYITLGGLDVTAETLYQRAGMSVSQRECLYHANVLPYDKNRQIPRQELIQVRERLKDNPLFLNFLRQNSRRALPAYEQYLKQEGLLDKVTSALVDSGWVGSMQKELDQSLRRLGRKEPLVGFYWGLYEIPGDMDRKYYHTYFFSPEGQTARKAVFNNCLFEAVFTAPHGMTLGYQVCGEKSRPVLSEIQKDRIDRLTMIEQRFTAWQERFLRQIQIKSFYKLYETYEKSRTFRVITKNLELFMHHPTKEEAYVFGQMAFTDDVLEVKGRQIAAGISMRRSAWYEGCVSINRRYPEYRIALYTVYKYLLYERKKRRYIRREHIK